MKPNDGYEFDTLLIDGSPVTPSVYYQFSNVKSNHTITVTFREAKGVVIFLWTSRLAP